MRATRLVIVTGVSGSGKSTALKAFEDLGFLCIDNLPAPLFPAFIDFLLQLDQQRRGAGQEPDAVEPRRPTDFALLVDCREGSTLPVLRPSIERLKAAGIDVSLVFFDCLDEVIVRRFRETRRPHPLLLGRSFLESIAEAIARERELLANFRAAADWVIDTTLLTPHDLRRKVEEYCGHENQLEIFITSFGFKFGVPHDVDLVVDVRFLPNPHFVEDLRPLTGEDPKVADYVFSSGEAATFAEQYLKLLEFLLPLYEKEGKRYLTLGVGCTGGRHRSVALSIAFGEALSKQGHKVHVRHRDAHRPGSGAVTGT